MLIQYNLLLLLVVILYILIVFLCAKLWKKRSNDSVTGVLAGLLIGALVSFLLIILPQHIYVVTDYNEWQHYRSLGASSYTLKDGQQTFLSGSSVDGVLINESSQTLVLEEVAYGIAFTETFDIEPNAIYKLNQSYIDYLFADSPPDEISTQSEEPIIHLWLKIKN